MMNKYSSLIAGLFVIVFLPNVRYDQVTFVNPAVISTQRNIARAQFYAGRNDRYYSPGRYSGYTSYISPNWYDETSIRGSVNIQRYQSNSIVINRGSNNDVTNEVGVIGGR